MNIFVLDKNPEISAQSLDDIRLKRLCFECLEMLSMALEAKKLSLIYPYRHEQYNHPVSRWVRLNEPNYMWTLAYGISLCNEYVYRFGVNNEYAPYYLKILALTKVKTPLDLDSMVFRNSTINHKHIKDVIQAYKLHYEWKLKSFDKKLPKTWTKREPPKWLVNLCTDLVTKPETYIFYLPF